MGESVPLPADALPEFLARLLAAKGERDANAAWQAFVDAYSGLLLQVARSTVPGHDSAMDAYVFLLDALREHECRRLRGYVPREGTRFSTWLLVVARRLCVDFHRRKYGRRQGSSTHPEQAALERATRRRLVDLAAEELDLDDVADAAGDTPESLLRSTQLRTALAAELDALEPADRVLLAMRFEDGRSAASIAGALGFPTPFHVYRRLSHVFERLRARLLARGIHGSAP